MTDLDPSRLSAADRGGSRPRRRRRRQSRVPVSIKYLLPLAIAVVALLTWRDAWVASRAFVVLTGPDGAPLTVTSVTMQLYEYDDAPNAPSPTPPIGAPIEVPTGEFSLGDDVIPELVLCRLEAPGLGDGFGSLEPGGRTSVLRIGPPRSVRGQVLGGDRVGLGGAAVTILGGGARGVVLAETTTGADGTFTVDTVSTTVDPWGIRVVAPRHAIHNRVWFPGAPSEPEPIVALDTTEPAVGRLVAIGADAPPVDGRELRFFHVPGLSTVTAADGSFRIDHLPAPPLRTVILVPDLAAGWTLRRTRIAAGERDVVVEVRPGNVVQGRVVQGFTGRAAVGAVVFHEHGPNGVESTRTDAAGRFELPRLPEGLVEVFANLRVPLASLPPEEREGKINDIVELGASAPLTVVAGRPTAELYLELR